MCIIYGMSGKMTSLLKLKKAKCLFLSRQGECQHGQLQSKNTSMEQWKLSYLICLYSHNPGQSKVKLSYLEWYYYRLYLFVCLLGWWAGIPSFTDSPIEQTPRKHLEYGHGSFCSTKILLFCQTYTF